MSASVTFKRRMVIVARNMGESLNGENDSISKVLVVKPIIPANWFVRDFTGVEWEDDGTIISRADGLGTLVVPKDPRLRQTFSRTLLFERRSRNPRRMPRSHKAISKYVCDSLLSRFSDERVEVVFEDDDLSLINDDVTTSFIQIRDGEYDGEDVREDIENETSSISENGNQTTQEVNGVQTANHQGRQEVPRPFGFPSFHLFHPMRRFFNAGILPEPRRDIGLHYDVSSEPFDFDRMG